MSDVILFDCDGNVCDSEIVAMDVACKGLIEEARRQGATIPYSYVFSLFGKTIQNMMDLLGEQYGVVYKPEIKKDIHAQTISELSVRTKAVDGAGEYLEAASSKGKKLVIVTSSELDRVIPSLKSAGLKPFFQDNLIFSATSTLNPPQPKSAKNAAVYLYALTVLGIQTSDTYTSEDSLSGAGSAAHGQVPCFGNVGGAHIADKDGHAEKLRQAGVISTFASWRELMPLLSVPHREIYRMRQDPKALAYYGLAR